MQSDLNSDLYNSCGANSLNMGQVHTERRCFVAKAEISRCRRRIAPDMEVKLQRRFLLNRATEF